MGLDGVCGGVMCGVGWDVRGGGGMGGVGGTLTCGADSGGRCAMQGGRCSSSKRFGCAMVTPPRDICSGTGDFE